MWEIGGGRNSGGSQGGGELFLSPKTETRNLIRGKKTKGGRLAANLKILVRQNITIS